ncbi:MAG: phytase, partial [Saprospiraceae bacterium]|nr:phytase [Saprospiraceae bacterium]
YLEIMKRATNYSPSVKNGTLIWLLLFFLWRGMSCENSPHNQQGSVQALPVQVLSDSTFDYGEFTLWINEDDIENSLVIVADIQNGGIQTFNMKGERLDKTPDSPFCKPNTLKIASGLEYGDLTVSDIVGLVDQKLNKVRMYRLPELEPIDGGGLQLFAESESIVIDGLALYVRDRDDVPYLLAGCKDTSRQNYWTQFELYFDDLGIIQAREVRAFGMYENQETSPLTMVDQSQEYFYYSDHGFGVRKYHADPDKGDDELAIIQPGFSDIKSLSAYTLHSPGGYLVAGETDRLLFISCGSSKAPHQHDLIKTMSLQSKSLYVTSMALDSGSFAKGAFISQYKNDLNWYDWRDISGGQLILAPNGIPDHTDNAVKPKFITEATLFDTDDPAIWIHPDDPSQSLIIGTDKEDGGGIYVYDLEGKIQRDKVVTGLHRPNNVDVAYGLKLAGRTTDFIVATERNNADVRVFSFPEMEPIDGGGIPVFDGEEERDPMGVGLYKEPGSGDFFAIVGRKTGPSDGYLWQYRVEDDGTGMVQFTKVREFGKFSGNKEIEAIAVDEELGFVYYSDEGVGIRKYYADPGKGNNELAIFGQSDFGQDQEGISIYKVDAKAGYILVSDQQQNHFNIYPRECTAANPHDHQLIKSVEVSTMESDGSEVTAVPLGDVFPNGLLVAMSTDKTFHLYDWREIAGNDLAIPDD